MENNLLKISARINVLAHELSPVVTGHDAELTIINAVADELLSEMGEIERYDDVKLALVNMFVLGGMFPTMQKRVNIHLEK